MRQSEGNIWIERVLLDSSYFQRDWLQWAFRAHCILRFRFHTSTFAKTLFICTFAYWREIYDFMDLNCETHSIDRYGSISGLFALFCCCTDWTRADIVQRQGIIENPINAWGENTIWRSTYRRYPITITAHRKHRTWSSTKANTCMGKCEQQFFSNYTRKNSRNTNQKKNARK